MARVTVEDCLPHIENRFQLVLEAEARAKDLIKGGAVPKVDWENDKATVVALREIAAGHKFPKDDTPEPLEPAQQTIKL